MIDLSSGTYETKYMTFRLSTLKSGLHEAWDILNKSGGYLLGEIFWYPAWRQFIFRPCPATEFNKSCLTEIVGVLSVLNATTYQQKKRVEASGK